MRCIAEGTEYLLTYLCALFTGGIIPNVEVWVTSDTTRSSQLCVRYADPVNTTHGHLFRCTSLHNGNAIRVLTKIKEASTYAQLSICDIKIIYA